MIYLIHFSRPFKHATHYLGFAETFRSLVKRLERHRSGAGAKLLRAVKEAGIDFHLVRVWYGPGATRTEERRLKGRGGRSRLCPVCCNHKKSVNNIRLS